LPAIVSIHDRVHRFLRGQSKGLYGSGSIAANLSRYFKNPEVIAMLNTDIPGGDKSANSLPSSRSFACIRREFRANALTPTPTVPPTTPRLRGA